MDEPQIPAFVTRRRDLFRQEGMALVYASISLSEAAAGEEDLGVSDGAELERRPGLLEALGAVWDLRAGILIAHRADRIAPDVYVAELVKRELRAVGAGVAPIFSV
jgi:hypothetical protein